MRVGGIRVSGLKLTKYQGLLLITQVTGGPRANRELVMRYCAQDYEKAKKTRTPWHWLAPAAVCLEQRAAPGQNVDLPQLPFTSCKYFPNSPSIVADNHGFLTRG